ncbi:hypothetical protein FB45DRAFT_999669 [Roridomyces roridus]|uniref:Uncharacterized protein n=1 Tax=Roridomyces roridus TaxID=1738132 RepID=A0AAD7FVC2_9AGAR|nr:hypothetical protein FB45DRAFT_999669 [Roridomyces roridus]
MRIHSLFFFLAKARRRCVRREALHERRWGLWCLGGKGGAGATRCGHWQEQQRPKEGVFISSVWASLFPRVAIGGIQRAPRRRKITRGPRRTSRQQAAAEKGGRTTDVCRSLHHHLPSGDDPRSSKPRLALP